ncbi:MAG: TetR/AcrR family transcriptional regulator [Nitrospinae bacterium]|nr:TetR/AcrR family transcriptional regulator [Nitrospinota bacterium]
MPRAKEYDRDEVLEQAALVFWSKGFEAASMADLVAATGLNTFSMYREFGSKEGLFEASLDSYYHTVLTRAVNGLRETPGLPSIKEFLFAFPPIMATRDYKGCLYVNTLTEKSVVNDRAITRVAGFCAELTGLLEDAIKAAQKKGEIASGKNAKALANYFLMVVQGLSIYGRVVKDRKMIHKVVETALSALEG